MLSAYIPIAIFVVVATGFALFTLVFSSLLHSEKYNKEVFSEYVGLMIFLSGEVFVGEFSGGFKPNGEGMMFFVVGATLRGFFHEGKVHNSAIISLPFDVLIFGKFSKGVLNSEVTRIDARARKIASMSSRR